MDIMKIVNLQNKIYKLDSEYVIKDIDLCNLYSISNKKLKKIINKNMNIFPKKSIFINNKELLFTEKAIIILSILIDNNYIRSKCMDIMDIFDYIRKDYSIQKLEV